MIPHERSLVKKLADKPFALIGVNSDKDREVLKQQLAQEGMAWRHFYDQSISGPIATAWNIHGWPTTFILDHKGVIRYRDLRDEDAEEAILTLLEEMAASQRKSAPQPLPHDK